MRESADYIDCAEYGGVGWEHSWRGESVAVA